MAQNTDKAAHQQQLRKLPKMDDLLARDDVAHIEAPRWAVHEALRREVDGLRTRILAGESVASGDRVEVDITAVERSARELCRPSLRRVINATGVVLHTNMGRAPLSRAVIERLGEVGGGYSNLEYDIDKGKRGSRHGHVTQLVCDLTGAEDAVVVNNNAAAVMLGLAGLCFGHQAIVSRGELVEIGGSFRIPDVMALSRAELVEVGTTNKTRVADYDNAITDDTRLLLKVHRSNFAVVGFTEEASIAELALLGRERGIPVMLDLGSGALLTAAQMIELGLPAEPGVREHIASGADIVTFSGDKLLGGPQAGILAGRKDAIERCRKHPLMRALRPDKLIIGALEATLRAYRDGDAMDTVPTWAMMSAPIGTLRGRAEKLVSSARSALGETLAGAVQLCECKSTVGGGAMPLATLPSWGIAIGSDSGPSAGLVDRTLRAAELPVVGRIADDRLILDVRTIADLEHEAVVAAIARLAELD